MAQHISWSQDHLLSTSPFLTSTFCPLSPAPLWKLGTWHWGGGWVEDDSAEGSQWVRDNSAGEGWQVRDSMERTVRVAKLICLPVKRVDSQFNKYRGQQCRHTYQVHCTSIIISHTSSFSSPTMLALSWHSLPSELHCIKISSCCFYLTETYSLVEPWVLLAVAWA